MRVTVKEKLECYNCGEVDQGLLVYHHLVPIMKKYNVSDMRGYSQERRMREIDKCICLCQNCHAKVHRELELSSRMMNQDVDYSIED